MRSAAARLRAETAEKLASLHVPKRPKVGVCPICQYTIYTDQKTAWRSVDGVTSRVHADHEGTDKHDD